MLGNGRKTKFWHDIWIGDLSLKDRFPRLFSISNQKDDLVADVWRPVSGEDSWRLLWRRRFFDWEEQLLEDLKGVISQVLLAEAEDCWCWRPDRVLGFSVNSAYQQVSSISNIATLDTQWHTKIFDLIWMCLAPSKICGFAWQLLHDRIPTKNNLLIRRVIEPGEDGLCVAGRKLNLLLIICSCIVEWRRRCGWR
jgi:hypothetical protein